MSIGPIEDLIDATGADGLVDLRKPEAAHAVSGIMSLLSDSPEAMMLLTKRLNGTPTNPELRSTFFDGGEDS